MIYDRPYMRSDYERREASALTWILAVTIGAYVIQSIFEVWFKMGAAVAHYFALSQTGLASGFIWTPITYALLHSGPFHILVNLLGVYFIGRELMNLLGSKRFLILYTGSILLGGLAWIAVAVATNTLQPLVGCSAAVFALLTVFACFYPDRPITFLLFFILPVTMKPKHLAIAAAGISGFCFLFLELSGRASIAHSSHLAGMAAGWLYFRYVHKRAADLGGMRTTIEMPAWLKRKKAAAAERSFKVNISQPRDIKAEVDRILDKINSQGFGALTDEERRVLDDARDVLNKR